MLVSHGSPLCVIVVARSGGGLWRRHYCGPAHQPPAHIVTLQYVLAIPEQYEKQCDFSRLSQINAND
jgi:hypothetical protein